MGFDDGDCEESAARQHVFVLREIVMDSRGQLQQIHECALCGVEAYEASDDPGTRPPL